MNITGTKFFRVLFLTLFSLSLSIPLNGYAQDAQKDDDTWQFTIAPYMLFPFITGDTSVGRIDGADIDVDPGDIFGALELGGMIYVDALHESGFGASINYAFMDLGDDASGPFGFVDFDADIFQGIFEGYLFYQFDQESGPLEIYSGVRWWDIDIDIDATARGPMERSRRFSNGDDWVDPVIGTRWRPAISDDWSLILKGDIGGFNAASDFSWNVQAGVLWEMQEDISLVFQYRVLSVDYSKGARGTPDRFAYDTITHGPLLGVAFTL